MTEEERRKMSELVRRKDEQIRRLQRDHEAEEEKAEKLRKENEQIMAEYEKKISDTKVAVIAEYEKKISDTKVAAKHEVIEARKETWEEHKLRRKIEENYYDYYQDMINELRAEITLKYDDAIEKAEIDRIWEEAMREADEEEKKKDIPPKSEVV